MKRFLLFLALAATATAQVLVPWRTVTGTPTTAAGYGITNGAALDTIGANGSAYYLNSSNQSAGTLPAARLPAFTGDATSTAGTAALTLANTAVTAGTYGSATQVPQFVVDAKGRITGVTLVTATPAFSSLTGVPTTVAGHGITNGAALDTIAANGSAYYLNSSNQASGTLPAARLPAFTGDATTSAGSSALTLATVNSNVGSFGSATQSLTVTFDAKGRATAVSAQTVTPAWGSITGKPTTASGFGITNGSTLDSWGAKAVPTGTVLGTSDTQTLTNKDLSGASNTYRAASTSTVGAVQLATGAETTTGTDSSKVVTPAGWAFASAAGRNALAPRGGISQDGSNTALVTATLTSQTIGTDPFTLSFVASVPSSNPSTSTGWGCNLTTSAATNNGNNDLYFYIATDGTLQLIKRDGSASFQSVGTVNNFVSTYGGKVVHGALVRAASGWTFYINGTSVMTSSSYYTESVASNYLGTNAIAGAWGSHRVFAASLYNLALSAADVREVYELGGAVPERFKFGSQVAKNTSTFTNSGYDTFSGASVSGFSAVKSTTGSGSKFANANPQTFYLSPQQQVRVKYDLTLNSGHVPYIGISGSAGDTAATAGTNQSTVLTNSGAGSSNSGMYFYNLSGEVSDYVLANVSFVVLGAVVHLPLDDGLGFQLQDAGTNRLHGYASPSGVAHLSPFYGPAHLRATTSTNGNQQIGGQVSIPANSQIIRARARARTNAPTVTVGTASGGAQVVASVALSTSWKDLTIALTGGMVGSSNVSLWVGSNSTDVIEWDFTWDPLSP